MINDTLADTTRAAHDVGLAAWLGGSMFGKFAMNPSVAGITDKRERGKVTNAAWNAYNLVNALSLGTAAAGYLAARATELRPDNLSGRESTLATLQDGLMIGAVVSGVVTGIQGARLARQAPEGAVPIETGTRPALETPPEAAKIQRSLEVLGNASILLGVGLVACNAVASRGHFSHPPARRALLRRS